MWSPGVNVIAVAFYRLDWTRRMKQPLTYQMFSTPEQSNPSLAGRQIKQGSSQPVNQANSLSENILVGAPPSLPPLGPSPHEGTGVGLAWMEGGLGRGALPHHPKQWMLWILWTLWILGKVLLRWQTDRCWWARHVSSRGDFVCNTILRELGIS